jgi:hypothetical protein
MVDEWEARFFELRGRYLEVLVAIEAQIEDVICVFLNAKAEV